MSAAKKNYHHGNLRAALLEVADQLLSERGVDAVTTRACARAVGVAPSAVFRHFKDRRALLTELSCDYLQAIQADLSAHPSGSAAQAQAYLASALAQPSQFQLMFNPELVDTRDPKYIAAQDAITAALTAKTPSTEQEGDMALLMRSAIHGLSMLASGGFLQDSLPADKSVREEVLDRCIARAAHSEAETAKQPSPKERAAPALDALNAVETLVPPRANLSTGPKPSTPSEPAAQSKSPLRRLAERALEHERSLKSARAS